MLVAEEGSKQHLKSLKLSNFTFPETPNGTPKCRRFDGMCTDFAGLQRCSRLANLGHSLHPSFCDLRTIFVSKLAFMDVS